jgi:hypothetical protein
MTFIVVVQNDTMLSDVAETFEDTGESILIGINDTDTGESILMGGNDAIPVRRELLQRASTTKKFVRLLRLDEGGLPNGCFVAEKGISDEQCKAVSKGNFSYKCGPENGYVCCKEKLGLTINTGSIAGGCNRNNEKEDDTTGEGSDDKDKEDLVFDPEVPSITARAVNVDCEKFDIEVEEGNECVRVFMTMAGPNENDLFVFEQAIEDSIETGTFDDNLILNGLLATTIQWVTESPTSAPSIEEGGDPCPGSSGDCKGCVTNESCLWCPANGVCFNKDTDKRASVTGGDVSRFLEEKICTGIITGLSIVCDVENDITGVTDAPSETKLPISESPVLLSPTFQPTSNTTNTTDPKDKSSGVRSESTTRNSLVSGIFSAILLSLV